AAWPTWKPSPGTCWCGPRAPPACGRRREDPGEGGRTCSRGPPPSPPGPRGRPILAPAARRNSDGLRNMERTNERTSAAEIRDFIVTNFLFGEDAGLRDEDSLNDAGVIDSTGVIELVTFLEDRF